MGDLAPARPPSITTVPADDVELSLTAVGDGPLVLMMHGFPDTSRTWAALQETLADAGFRAAALALRGYVPSSLSRASDYSLSALVRDVIAVLDHERERQAILIGHDWGASAAYATAASHPSRVERMVTLAIASSSLVSATGRISRHLPRSGSSYSISSEDSRSHSVERNT